ncbi:MAG: cytochrome c biogenesis protein CcsA [Candidatus Omnitrophica bacterium]|nr:cytochrome c biogenesis protein CcsA [Candidatus Omnitrophota bacterium]
MTLIKHKKLLLPMMLFLLAGIAPAYADASSAINTAKHIPIQHNGRIKPFDSFARQTVKLITGSERWQKKEPTAVMLDQLSNLEGSRRLKWIRLNYAELKQTLALPPAENFFSMEEIQPSMNKLLPLLRSSQAKRDQDLRPVKLEQKAEFLYTQLMTLERLISGELATVVPGAETPEAAALPAEFERLLGLYRSGSFQEFEEGTRAWIQKVGPLSKEISHAKILLEVRYFEMKPFEWAAAGYLLSFVLLLLFKHSRLLRGAALAALAGGFLLHTLGLAMRIVVLSRPPVSNMYESMVFMNWVAMLGALLFALLYRNLPILTVGSLASGFIMVYGNLLPLDSSLDVLVPVLRSNYWLTIHVLTIVSSYGAFGLAMALGHRHLLCAAFNKFSESAKEESARLIYRVIQLGTILIGAGTVLGGVWANESWGRFWGWDPKETWALITCLVYLAIVHLWYSKRINDFWLAMSSVLCFFSVLMTWYGVNFVLGRGLHSYGFGAGGMAWINVYLLLEALFVLFILSRRYAGKPQSP